MPRVGSSKIMTCGCIDSHLASTTFCWLPPDSVPTSVVDRRRLDVEPRALPLGVRRLGAAARRCSPAA